MSEKYIRLNQAAFINMISSGLEVYKKESYGILLGMHYNGASLVRNVLNYQTAKRTYDYVDVTPSQEKKVTKALKYLSKYRLIGDFHSHSDFPDRLSRHDRKDLLAKGDKWVSMLLVIKDTTKKTPWSYSSQGKWLAGSVGRKFFVKMHAYKNYGGRIEKVRIECPYIRKLNKKHF